MKYRSNNLYNPTIHRLRWLTFLYDSPLHTQLSNHFSTVCLALLSFSPGLQLQLLCRPSLVRPTVPPWHLKPTAETLRLLRPEEHLQARLSTLALAIVCVGTAYKGSLSRVCSITPFQALISENTVTKQQGLPCSDGRDVSICQTLPNYICCFLVRS